MPELSPQRSRNKADGIISELLSSGLVPAAAADVADHFSEKNVLIALEVAMNKAMESSQHARFLVGELVVELMKQQRLVSLKELVTT